MDGQWTFQSLLLQPLFPVFAQCLMWNSWLNVMTYLLDIQTLNCKKMFISWNSRLRCEENWSRQSTENGGRPKSCSLNFNQTRLPTHFDWQISHQLCTQLTTLANYGIVWHGRKQAIDLFQTAWQRAHHLWWTPAPLHSPKGFSQNHLLFQD